MPIKGSGQGLRKPDARPNPWDSVAEQLAGLLGALRTIAEEILPMVREGVAEELRKTQQPRRGA